MHCLIRFQVDKMRGSRFVSSMPPVTPYTGPLEPDEPNQPHEPMPLKKRLQFFLDKVSGMEDL